MTVRARRLVALLALLLAVAGLTLLLPSTAAGGNPQPSGQVAVRLTVDPGQTLWQIARAVAPSADPRATIARIKEMNGLSSSAIQAGQVLSVPAR